MVDKLLSARFLSTVLVIGTLCILLIIVVSKCFLMPEAFDKLKDLVMLLAGAFVATVSSIVAMYFGRADRENKGGGKNV